MSLTGVRPGLVDDGDFCVVQLRMRGLLKNRLVSAAAERGLSLNQFGALCIKAVLDEEADIAPPPPAHAPLPTVQEVLRSYLEGSEDKLLAPCGKAWPCEADGNLEDVGGVDFCGSCGIRVT